MRTNWATAVNVTTGRPAMNPEASDYGEAPKIVFPATPGARNWHPASFDPQTGLYYAAVLDMGNLIFTTPGRKPYARKMLNNDAALIFGPDIEAALPSLPPPMQAAVKALPAFDEVKRQPFVSELRAIDPLTGQTRWAVPARGWQDRAGVLTTASGLVFQGSIDGTFRAFDMRDGRLLKSIDTGSSILAAPMTYRVNGVQYVAVMAAWGGGGFPYVPRYSAAYRRGNQGRILAFRLGRRCRAAAARAAVARSGTAAAGAAARGHGGHPRARPRALLRQLRAVPFEPASLDHAGPAPHAAGHARGISPHRARGSAARERHAALGRSAQCRRRR